MNAMEVDCQSVKKMVDEGVSFLFLDCRESDEYATASIPGARLLPMSEIASRIGELESYKGSEIVVHCHHGGRSLRVTNWMRQQGYLKTRSMAGGIDEWSQTIDQSVPRY